MNKQIGRFICRLTRKHKAAVFEFAGYKPDLSTPEGCIKGIPIYKVSCPRCRVSVLMGEDEFARALAKALEKQGRYKNIRVVQYTSGYKPPEGEKE